MNYTSPESGPEIAPDRTGINIEDIDEDTLLNIVRMYLEEAFPTREEPTTDIEVSRYANMTGMWRYDKSSDSMEVQVEEAFDFSSAEFRFGSSFSHNSKLWFRIEHKLDESIVWADFDANMDNPPPEFFKAQDQFNARVSEYLSDRNLAVPIYF